VLERSYNCTFSLMAVTRANAGQSGETITRTALVSSRPGVLTALATAENTIDESARWLAARTLKFYPVAGVTPTTGHEVDIAGQTYDVTDAVELSTVFGPVAKLSLRLKA